MRVDRHYDPIDELEKNILKELEGITKQLGGTMCQSTRCNSVGRQSKVIEIEYNVEER
jgi:hypothetical protein